MSDTTVSNHHHHHHHHHHEAARTSFNLRHMRVGPTLLQSLKAHENLQEVWLGPIFSSTITNVASIVEWLPPSLQWLYLDLSRLYERRTSACVATAAHAVATSTCSSSSPASSSNQDAVRWSHEMQSLLRGLPVSVEHLSLRFPHFKTNNHQEDVGVVALTESIIQQNSNNSECKRIPCVRTLELKGNHIGDPGAIALAKSLPHIPNLRHLILRWNNIGSEGMIALASGLPCTTIKLEKLDLSHNKLLSQKDFDQTLKAFIQVLKTDTHLKELSLPSCITPSQIILPVVVQALLECLQKYNVTLEYIHLQRSKRPTRHDPRAQITTTATTTATFSTEDHNTSTTTDGSTTAATNQHNHNNTEGKSSKSLDALLRDMEYYLSLNRAGRRLLQKDDSGKPKTCNNNNNKNIPLGIWPHILARKQTRSVSFPDITTAPNALFYFLRERPELCGHRTKNKQGSTED